MGIKRDTKAAAERLSLKPGTLEVWRVQGKGPQYMKIGRLVRYDDDDLLAFEEQSRFGSTSEYREEK